ncbi:MAG: hypothetical protein R2716_14145 [Microthrixaceae bacterium]
MTAELHSLFEQHPFVHVSTYGGAELGCAAALATLDVIESPGFLERTRSWESASRPASGAAASSCAGGGCSWAWPDDPRGDWRRPWR